MTDWNRQRLSHSIRSAAMSLAFNAERQGRRPPIPRAPDSAFSGRRFVPSAAARTPASQVRADRRRVQRRDEQAVAAWLRELAARPR
jgi:hypothetical protein